VQMVTAAAEAVATKPKPHRMSSSPVTGVLVGEGGRLVLVAVVGTRVLVGTVTVTGS
jgi:hypothetical protein